MQPILTTTEIQTRLADASVSALQEMVADNEKRMAPGADRMSMTAGVFYASDYAHLLQVHNSPFLKTFKDKGHFYHGYLSPQHFDHGQNEQSVSGYEPCSFIVKSGVPAQNALDRAKKGYSLIGCGEICQVAEYAALASVFGPDKFNTLFARSSKTPLVIDTHYCVNPLNLLRRRICQEVVDLSTLQKGDYVYIENTSNYLNRWPIGNARGYNTLCTENVTEPKFTSLGLSSEGLTHSEVEQVLLQECNFEERPPSLDHYSERIAKVIRKQYSEAFGKAEALRKTALTFEEFKANGGGRTVLTSQLDVERISALVNASIAEARALFTRYDEERRANKK